MRSSRQGWRSWQRPLVVLHISRTKSHQAQAPAGKALLAALTEAGCFYPTPFGSNDDWYWMYAAVAAGADGLLVSNDEMRDHLFHMLAPKFFDKWKQRHQTRYTFSGPPSTLVLDYPRPYTVCGQRLAGSGAWVFPCNDGTWVCAKPDASSSPEIPS